MRDFLSVDSKYIKTLEWVFKISFLAYALLSFNSLSYGRFIISAVLWPTVFLGCFLLIVRLVNYKKYLNMPGLIFLILFLGSYIVSFLGNLKYGYKEGIIKFVFILFYFGLLFLKRNDMPKESIKKEINILGGIFQVYMFFAVLISFILFITGYTSVRTIENGWDIGIGFLWGRLWGIFTEPNYGTVCSCITIALAIYFFKNVKAKKMKAFFVINILVQMMYIAFTDSRTGMVTLGVTMAFLTFNRLNYYRMNGIGKYSFKVHIIIIITCFTFITGFMIPNVITKVYNTVNRYVQVHQMEIEFEDEETDDQAENHIKITKQIDRGYDLSKDPTNRRFDIWKSGIEVFMTTPIIGTSYTNILPYTLANCEGTYMINNSAEKNFSSIHNEILNVLVGQGIIGVVIFITFIIFVGTCYIKFYFRCSREEELLNNVLVACMAATTSGAMFLTGMIYSNSPAVILFWTFLGCFLISIKEEGKK